MTHYQTILNKLGIPSLNEMQEKAIAAIHAKNDVVLLSSTGTGKTLAYLLPLLDRIDPRLEEVQVMVLAPSRELAIQIENVFKSLGSGIKVNSCYGGHSMQVEKNNLKHPPAVLIGTPGRIADHLRDGRINTRCIKTLVLDEFDKSLEFGFQDDMENIVHALRPQQRILTSATSKEEIPPFVGLKNPAVLNFISEDTVDQLSHKFILSDGKDKLETLFRLICKLGNKPMLVFSNHREAVERISNFLWLHQVPNGIYHGGMEQIDREKALIQFRNGSNYCLVTTDLASRGLDIPEIEFIIHYHLPLTEEAFIHRNGRTARMHASGTMFMILSPGEKLPAYINEEPTFDELPSESQLPDLPNWKTLYISAGKKDKVNKIDIVGYLLQQGKLSKDELGKIDVLDYASYAAVSATKADDVVRRIKNIPLKKKNVKIEIIKS